MTTHFSHDGQAACVARIKPPVLTGDTGLVTCKSCHRTDAYARSVPAAPRLPPVPDEHAVADPADVPLLRAWLERTAS